MPTGTLAALPSDLDAGTPLQLAYRKLLETGSPEPAALQAIASCTGGRANRCSRCGYAYAPSIHSCTHCGAGDLHRNVPLPPLDQTGDQSA